jgi:hypothetical protein
MLHLHAATFRSDKRLSLDLNSPVLLSARPGPRTTGSRWQWSPNFKMTASTSYVFTLAALPSRVVFGRANSHTHFLHLHAQDTQGQTEGSDPRQSGTRGHMALSDLAISYAHLA